jgi:hypothetical protein
MVLSLLHATFIFFPDPTYAWYVRMSRPHARTANLFRYLSSTALLLFVSYQVHNFVSYLKIRPLVPRWGQLVFLISLALVQPFWILEAYDNFAYFTGDSNLNPYTRPWEPLAREPWWLFTTCWLIYKIKSNYQLSVKELLKLSPRFGVMILCMLLSLAFVTVDIVVTADHVYSDEGVNPYWRVSTPPG